MIGSEKDSVGSNKFSFTNKRRTNLLDQRPKIPRIHVRAAEVSKGSGNLPQVAYYLRDVQNQTVSEHKSPMTHFTRPTGRQSLQDQSPAYKKMSSRLSRNWDSQCVDEQREIQQRIDEMGMAYAS